MNNSKLIFNCISGCHNDGTKRIVSVYYSVLYSEGKARPISVQLEFSMEDGIYNIIQHLKSITTMEELRIERKKQCVHGKYYKKVVKAVTGRQNSNGKC